MINVYYNNIYVGKKTRKCLNIQKLESPQIKCLRPHWIRTQGCGGQVRPPPPELPVHGGGRQEATWVLSGTDGQGKEWIRLSRRPHGNQSDFHEELPEIRGNVRSGIFKGYMKYIHVHMCIWHLISTHTRDISVWKINLEKKWLNRRTRMLHRCRLYQASCWENESLFSYSWKFRTRFFKISIEHVYN